MQTMAVIVVFPDVLKSLRDGHHYAGLWNLRYLD